MPESVSDDRPPAAQRTIPMEARSASETGPGRWPVGSGRAAQPDLDALRAILPAQLDHVVDQLVDSVSPSALARALADPSRFSAVAMLLASFLQEHSGVTAFGPAVSRQARLALARGDLLERAGGTCTTAEAATLLGITSDAVRKRVQRGTLLSYRNPSGEHRLPMAQFSESGTIEGLADVLRAMHLQDPWMRIQLFLDEDVRGALEDGRLEDALRAVRAYLPTDEGTNE